MLNTLDFGVYRKKCELCGIALKHTILLYHLYNKFVNVYIATIGNFHNKI